VGADTSQPFGALRAVSHIAKSYISWKSGEQRMRDTYDSL
jgi:hypothetical protein